MHQNNSSPLKIKWTSKTLHVDIDTGEQITLHQAKHLYSKIKTSKHAKINHDKQTGFIEYTIAYRSRQIQELPFANQDTNP